MNDIDFQVMCAADAPEDLTTLDYTDLWVQPKFDGIRAFGYDGIYSRQGKPIPNREIQRRYGSALQGLDFELYAKSVDFHTLSGIVRSESAPLPADFRPVVFDVIPRMLDVAYETRFHWLQQMERSLAAVASLALTVHVRRAEEVQRWHNHFRLNGLEGTMLRDGRMLYKNGRSTVKEQALLRIKDWVEFDGLIVGFFQAETNTNQQTRDARGFAKRSSHAAGKELVDTLGGFIVRQLDTGDRWRVSASALTHSQRKHIWENMRDFFKRPVVCKKLAVGEKKQPRMAGLVRINDNC